jgi:predicted Zn finger-like uncharacterized protein
MMDVSCDACSKRYRIDETRMKSDSAKVKCKACGHLFSVVRPQAADLVESIFETDVRTAPPRRLPPCTLGLPERRLAATLRASSVHRRGCGRKQYQPPPAR